MQNIYNGNDRSPRKKASLFPALRTDCIERTIISGKTTISTTASKATESGSGTLQTSINRSAGIHKGTRTC